MGSRSKTKGLSISAPSYVDLYPQCDWVKEEGIETLIVHLPCFKKEQLRVRVNDRGNLKISGEKIDDGKIVTRFLKETKIPQGCNIHDIRAKFKNGCLHITMPTKLPNVTQVQQHKDQPASTVSAVPHGLISDGNSPCDQPRNKMVGKVRSCLTRLQDGKNMNVTVSLGIATVAIVAFGAYLVCSNVNSGV